MAADGGGRRHVVLVSILEAAGQVRIPIESSTSYRGRNARPNWLTLIAFIALALAAGAVGFGFSPAHSPDAAAWYAALAKPVWTPPSRWFGPIWTALYVLIGIAVWLVSRERYHVKRPVALAAWGLQLLLNAAWAPLFFGWRNLGAGLFDIVALWLATLWTEREFLSMRPAAAGLLLPYLAWITFAMALNFNLWRLNQ
jgi:translocator protein